MSCEEFRFAISETAGTATLAQEEHRARCESCRTFYGEQQKLFAAIEEGLSRAANGEPSASFLPRMRAALAKEDVARQLNAQRLRFAWWPAGGLGVALCFALLLAVQLYLNTAHEAVASKATTAILTPREGLTVRQTTGGPESPWPQEAATRQASRESVGPRYQNSRARPRAYGDARRTRGDFQNAEVIVGRDERDALAHFLAGIEERPGALAAFAHPTIELPAREDLIEAPLEIAQLDVQALNPTESEAK